MKKDLIFDYYYEFIPYKVHLTYKRIRNINYRFDKSKGLFKISAPYYSTQKEILKYLDEFAPNLIKRAKKKKSPYIENKVYVFGELKEIIISDENCVNDKSIEIKDKANLDKLLKIELKKYIDVMLPYYENIMGITPYRFSIKKMSTLHGSNSYYSHRISFSLSLVHYKKEIIDSVIVHELVHDKVRNHRKEFYEELLKYYPKYYIYHKALNNTDYAFEGNYK